MNEAGNEARSITVALPEPLLIEMGIGWTRDPQDRRKLTSARIRDYVAEIERLRNWRPIETAPKDTYKVTGPTLILGHCEKKWIRFGKWFVQEGCWYYSGTSERSQYAQVKGDAPTHWMPFPAPPEAA